MELELGEHQDPVTETTRGAGPRPRRGRRGRSDAAAPPPDDVATSTKIEGTHLSRVQWLMVVALVLATVGAQLFTVRTFVNLSDAAQSFNLAQNLTGDLADAQRDAIRVQLGVERLAGGLTTVDAVGLNTDFLGQQLDNVRAQGAQMPAAAEAKVAGASRTQARLSATLASLVSAPRSDLVAALPALRRDSDRLDRELHGLYTEFEISYYEANSRALDQRRSQQAWSMGLALCGIGFAIGLVLSLRRSVGRGFQRAYDALVAEESARRRAQTAVTDSERRLRELLRNSPDAVYLLSARGDVIWSGPTADSLGAEGNLLELVHPSARDAAELAFLRGLREPRSVTTLPTRLADGRHVAITFTNLLDDSAVGGVVTNLHDETAHVQMSRELERLAFHDGLTGLPNRLALEREIESRDPRSPLTLAAIQLDGFTTLAARLGRDATDHLQTLMARRLGETALDAEYVAHLGGNEFAVLVTGSMVAGEARALATRLQTAVSAPAIVLGEAVTATASVGFATAADPDGRHDLFWRADAATLQARERGHNQVHLFDDERHRQLRQQARLAEQLSSAVGRHELFLAHQPLVDARTGRILGTEALARWTLDGVSIPPDVFIATAEENGLICDVGMWVLDQACADLRSWIDQDGVRPDLSVSVNVSAIQLQNEGLVPGIRACLARHGLSPENLIVELTETSLLADLDRGEEALATLRGLGIRVSIDDFGTGYSSLGYLSRLSADSLKIDRSLLAGIKTDERALRLVRAIVDLAHDLGMKVTAEGVEDQVQLDLLRAAECDVLQGFYLSRPIPTGDIAVLLDTPLALPRGVTAAYGGLVGA